MGGERNMRKKLNELDDLSNTKENENDQIS